MALHLHAGAMQRLSRSPALSGLKRVQMACTWDGQQLVIMQTTLALLMIVWTLARNADGTYTPGECGQLQGETLPTGVTDLCKCWITWDGQQLVIMPTTPAMKIWTLARNADGTYTPAQCGQSRETLPSWPWKVSQRDNAWDGQQLVIMPTGDGDEDLDTGPER